MKISIISIHAFRNNFGSVLQSYSLCRFLKEHGHNVAVINYMPAYVRTAASFVGKIKLLLTNLCFLCSYIKRKKRFDEFILSSPMTKEYTDFDELKSNPPQADCYIAGSDQLWNPTFPCGRDDAFYLSFTDSRNKIAYSTSIGTASLCDSDYDRIVKKISNFKYVSVREKLSCEKLIQHGRTDTKHVCDPVFLLSPEQYRALYTYKPRKKYIFVYAVEKDEKLEKVVNVLADKMKYEVVTVGGFRRKSSGYFPRWIGPKEFLGFLDNAEFVVVSSFHGTAFSLIFEKQFVVVPPRQNSLRLESILDIAGLQDRMVLDSVEIDDILQRSINYNIVTQRLTKHIEDSKEFLLTSLRNIETSLSN